MEYTLTKSCSRCKIEKPITEFYSDKQKRDGFSCQCRSCIKIRQYQYRRLNPDKVKKIGKKSRQNNREKVAERKRIWQEANREKHREYSKKWREQNREVSLQYYQDNKEKLSEINRLWKKENPEKVRRYNRKRRAMELQVSEQYIKEDEAYTRSLFEDQCFRCGSTDNLTIDHHRPLSRRYGLSRGNAVLLCRSCNSSKNNKEPEDFYTEQEITDLYFNFGIGV